MNGQYSFFLIFPIFFPFKWDSYNLVNADSVNPRRVLRWWLKVCSCRPTMHPPTLLYCVVLAQPASRTVEAAEWADAWRAEPVTVPTVLLECILVQPPRGQMTIQGTACCGNWPRAGCPCWATAICNMCIVQCAYHMIVNGKCRNILESGIVH